MIITTRVHANKLKRNITPIAVARKCFPCLYRFLPNLETKTYTENERSVGQLRPGRHSQSRHKS